MMPAVIVRTPFPATSPVRARSACQGPRTHSDSSRRVGSPIVLALLLLAVPDVGCGPSHEAPVVSPSPVPSSSVVGIGSVSVPSSTKPPNDGSLDTEDLVVGTGPVVERGQRVRMYYVGTLENGTEFDRTLRRPFEFQLGSGEVIAGWDQGIPGMHVGGKRKIVIPPELGYGARGVPPTIPPNATLIFEVELLEVVPP